MVDEALAVAMNDCAVDFPSGDSEVDATGLATLTLRRRESAAPRRGALCAGMPAASRARLRRRTANSWSARCCGCTPATGLIDQDNMYVDLDAYRPIGRMFGNLYATQRDIFSTDAREPRGVAARGRAPKRLSDGSVSRTAPYPAPWSRPPGSGRSPGCRARLPAAGGGAPCRRSPSRWRRRRPRRCSARPTSIILASVPSPDAVSATRHLSGRSPARRSIRPIWRR